MSHYENYSPAKINQDKRDKTNHPDLMVNCLLCNTQFGVKYIPPKKQYSRKNNWGYWTQKEEDKQKYLCNACLIKLYDGNINDWIENETRADVFYNYVKRGQFTPK